MIVLCKCGHDVIEHGLSGCDCCGCTAPSGSSMLQQRLLDSDRIKKDMAKLANHDRTKTHG